MIFNVEKAKHFLTPKNRISIFEVEENLRFSEPKKFFEFFADFLNLPRFVKLVLTYIIDNPFC